MTRSGTLVFSAVGAAIGAGLILLAVSNVDRGDATQLDRQDRCEELSEMGANGADTSDLTESQRESLLKEVRECLSEAGVKSL